MLHWLASTLKAQNHHDVKFVVTGDIVGCRYDNLWCNMDDKISIMKIISFQ